MEIIFGLIVTIHRICREKKIKQDSFSLPFLTDRKRRESFHERKKQIVLNDDEDDDAKYFMSKKRVAHTPKRNKLESRASNEMRKKIGW